VPSASSMRSSAKESRSSNSAGKPASRLLCGPADEGQWR
jgi:hypothetical protein